MRCKYLQAVGMVIVISDDFSSFSRFMLFFRARSQNVNKTMKNICENANWLIVVLDIFFIIQVFGGLLYAQLKYMKILRKNKKIS